MRQEPSSDVPIDHLVHLSNRRTACNERFAHSPVIDHANSTALALAPGLLAPTNFAKATRILNQIARIRPHNQGPLKFRVLFIGEKSRDLDSEKIGFAKLQHDRSLSAIDVQVNLRQRETIPAPLAVGQGHAFALALVHREQIVPAMLADAAASGLLFACA